MADGARNRSQIDYTDQYHAKPAGIGETAIHPYWTSDPHGFRTGANYYYYTGQLVQSFNLLPSSGIPQQVTTTYFDFADRPVLTIRPDGGQVFSQYWDNWLALGTTQQIEGAFRYKWDISDGAGRAYKKSR